MEKSFILYKPDAINKKVVTETHQLTHEYGITLINRYNKVLLSEDIDIMWPQCKEEYILNQLLKKYLCNIELPIEEYSGKSAIHKCNVIKEKIRKKYAICRFANCLHTPSNEKEYNFQKTILSDSFNFLNSENLNTGNYIPKKFNRFLSLSIEEKQEYVNKIWYRILQACKNRTAEKELKGYTLYLCNDDNNRISYVISCLYQYIIDMPLDELYYKVLVADYAKGIPIYTEYTQSKAFSLRDILCENGLNILIVET